MNLSLPTSWTLLLLAAGPGAPAAGPRVAVKAVHGDVQVQDGARWRPLAAGDALPATAELRTGPQARAALTLPAGDVLVVEEETALRMEAAQAPRMQLAKGGLEAGQVRRVESGTVSEPRPLPGTPEPSAPALDARFFCPGLVLRLEWTAVRRAAGYRVQVARDAAFLSPVLSTTAARTHALFVAPSPSAYFWRVAAVDGEGTAGAFSQVRPIHCEAEAPRDLLLAPEPGARVRPEDREQPVRVDFQWTPVEGARGYRLVLAPTPDLRAPEAQTQLAEGPQVSMEGLAPGTWYWGVFAGAAEEGGPERPLYLTPRRLDVEPRRARVRVPTVIREWGQ
jgi:hypothetical protein